MKVVIKRIYEKPEPYDGERILVDRLWPRGVSKERAKLDLWLKDIAPSTQLREWFNHDPKKWKEFQKKYLAELKTNTVAIEKVKGIAKNKTVTLLYAAKDEDHNEAIVIKDFIFEGR